MIPIVCIVGKSEAGKTTFMEKLIPELTKRGRMVATIKHDSHGFEVDHPGKDSWRHAQAGSRAVVLASREKVALMKELRTPMTLDELVMLVEGDADIVLAEGYKNDDKPKIEVHRQGVSKGLVSKEGELIALVTDVPLESGVPQFDPNDAAGIADLLESSFLSQRRPEQVSLVVDGRAIVLKGFASSMLDRILRAQLSLLEGCEDAKEVTLILRPKR